MSTDEPKVKLSNLPDEGGVRIEAETDARPPSPFMLFMLGLSFGFLLGTLLTLLVL